MCIRITKMDHGRVLEHCIMYKQCENDLFLSNQHGANIGGDRMDPDRTPSAKEKHKTTTVFWETILGHGNKTCRLPSHPSFSRHALSRALTHHIRILDGYTLLGLVSACRPDGGTSAVISFHDFEKYGPTPCIKSSITIRPASILFPRFT